MWFLLTTAARIGNLTARLVNEARRRKGYFASLGMLRLLLGAYWFYAKAYVHIKWKSNPHLQPRKARSLSKQSQITVRPPPPAPLRRA